MILLWLAACGPSLPEWMPALDAGPFEVPGPDEIRLEAAPDAVEKALRDEGWTVWTVVDESLIESHHVRVERDAVWVDLRSTESGSRLLRIEAPAAQPVSPKSGLPKVLSDAERLLPVAQMCQSDGADLKFTPGRYSLAKGRTIQTGTWRLNGANLVMTGPSAKQCDDLVLVGEAYPKYIGCGAEPYLWCNVPRHPPTAVVDAGGGAERVAQVAGLAAKPLEGTPSYVFSASGSASPGIRVQHADTPEARGRAEALAYRIRRDLGARVTLASSARLTAPVVVEVGEAVTGGSK